MSPQIATSTRVGRAGMLEFARPRHHAILITTRSDGSPQASPVTCGIDGSGRVSIATYPERAKTVNARRSGTASVVVLSDD
ncbi:MAG TPA: pyridoxamine 5'-phosphate oxidase family protein, partial [Streptosporangiaceae bacterium]|nr:pyridoxamine 5'-phosphate oxidase family protein [Streptosporangiaceae bacterium]